MKKLTESQVKNNKEKLIRKNRINNRIKKNLDEYIYNGINDIKYLLSENEDKITHNSNSIKDNRYLFNENEDKITLN